MKESIKQEVLQRMLPLLDNAQTKALEQSLESVLCKYMEDKSDKDEISSQELLQKFLEAKRIEGCSEKTLTYYQNTINRMLTETGKEVTHIMTEDLRSYLTDYQKQNSLSRVTIDNVRRILSSFFSWLEDEEYLIKSPIRRIHKVKTRAASKTLILMRTWRRCATAARRNGISRSLICWHRLVCVSVSWCF